jgi:hypothetical protein
MAVGKSKLFTYTTNLLGLKTIHTKGGNDYGMENYSYYVHGTCSMNPFILSFPVHTWKRLKDRTQRLTVIIFCGCIARGFSFIFFKSIFSS